MLNEKQIKLVVTSAMSKYAAENNGKRGIAKKDVITAVAEYGGDGNDVRLAMLVAMKRITSGTRIAVC